MIDEHIKEFLDQQKTIIEKLSKSKEKDRWDKLAILSTFLSSIVIAAVGIYFTNAYKGQEVRVSEAQVIEKLVLQLSGTNENAKKGALIAASSLGDKEMAARLGALYASAGTIEAIEMLIRNARGVSKDLLGDSLVDAYFNRGLNNINKEINYDQAITDYDKIFKLKSESKLKQMNDGQFLSDCYLYRGLAYYRTGKYEEAVSDYGKGLEIKPHDCYAYWYLGAVYANRNYSKKDLDKALQYYNSAVTYGAEETVYLERGDLYLQKGDIGGAIADYSKYISIKDDDYNGYYKRAIAYGKKKDFGNAEEDLKKAQRLAKDRTQREEANKKLEEIKKHLNGK